MGAHTRAFVGATLCAVLLAGCSPGIDYENGTYVFTRPGTEYVDPSTVLVRDGVVTDVWISDDDRTGEHYGYTPDTPQSLMEYAEATSEEWVDGDLTLCAEPGTANENCVTYEDLTANAGDMVSAASGWKGLADGTYRFDTRSVTWESPMWSIAVVRDGVVAEQLSASGDVGGLNPPAWKSASHDWVRYWVDGASEPFAACQDNLLAYDEEWCVVWSPAS